MPTAPLRPCAHPGCPERVPRGRCSAHAQALAQRIDAQRETAQARGYDWRWYNARTTYLRRHPLCVSCEREGRVTPATVVDHIRRHRGDRALFWDRSNWQALCARCHSRKTALEDGRWGSQR